MIVHVELLFHQYMIDVWYKLTTDLIRVLAYMGYPNDIQIHEGI